MFTKKIAPLLSVTLLVTLSLKAQKQDYVITLHGDTINCKFISDLKYKVGGVDKPKRVNFYEIKEYYIAKDNTLCRAVYRPGDRLPYFMTVVERGKIDLYEENYEYVLTRTSGITNNYSTSTWYIAKGTDTVKVLKSSDFSVSAIFLKSKKSRENIFADMIKDNKDVYDKYIADDKFNFGQIRYLVHLYNTGLPFGDPGKLKDPD